MNDELKRKYELLKQRNKKKLMSLEFESDVLFQECKNVLNKCTILSLNESKEIFSKFENFYPILSSGSIDWKNFKGRSIKISNVSELNAYINKFSKYYILWDKNNIPCISCNFCEILKNVDDVLAVSFNTWLLSMDYKEVIEFYHLGNITIGKINKSDLSIRVYNYYIMS